MTRAPARRSTRLESAARHALPDAALAVGAIAAVVIAGVAIADGRATAGASARPSSASSVRTPSPTTSSAAGGSTTGTTAARPTAVFIGDSYTTGAGGDGTKWTTLLAQREGWREVNLGYRGTGYGMEFHAPDCPAAGCPDYLQVVSRAVAAHPAIVVVSGGRNDMTNQARAATNIPKIFQQLRQDLPKARIVAVSPFWDSGSYPAPLTALGAEVRSAVQQVGGQYVDVGSPLSGKAGLLSSGGVYPNADGYRAIAAAVAAALGTT
ncbi:SGNH/GDSL hydrolase family protein [Allobranchiibius huperziae]|uniref:Lysophospholipase L1-like esterase n=1 Tax=Allobranchiibius huperziae TaxID=1874116 RepID=A0A853DFD4_9MICO|nr:SGNH/GDSL hydrolase family protein [Allobranchiibius huperziae]NYJ75518.1 lysophospholipase L1-like esterase [Allobranchiibius huperziae]